MDRKAFSAAFPYTVPVLMGYLSIGLAFGLMLEAAGFHALWALAMSLTIYAGSCQYLGVELLASGASFLQVAVLTLLINFRHLVYGLSMIEKFRGAGRKKPYLIFALTDETYALLSGVHPPTGVDPQNFYFAVSLLNQLYWVIGSVLGGLAGGLLQFNTEGIDFAMTALFLVIAVDQWKSYPSHLPAILGAGCTLVSLLLVGQQQMLLPALAAIILLLLALRGCLEMQGCAEEQEEMPL